jgi:hypothetical protein
MVARPDVNRLERAMPTLNRGGPAVYHGVPAGVELLDKEESAAAVRVHREDPALGRPTVASTTPGAILPPIRRFGAAILVYAIKGYRAYRPGDNWGLPRDAARCLRPHA